MSQGGNPKSGRVSRLGVYIVLGAAIGVAVGSATQQLALGTALGVAFGVLLGAGMEFLRRR